MSTRKIIESEDSQGWLTTFADLMTLLLVFFVLLFSMSSLEKERFSITANSLQKAINANDGGSLIPLPEVQSTPTTDAHESPNHTSTQTTVEPVVIAKPEPTYKTSDNQDDSLALEKVSHDLQNTFSSLGVADVVEVGPPKDGKIRIRVKGSVLFGSGDSVFKRQMMPILDGLLGQMEANPDYRIDIQGHTDNVPIETVRFPSNWELSAVRATTVLRYMVRGGIDPERLTATGYGESLPVGPNNTAEQRANNRRIEFVLEKIQK